MNRRCLLQALVLYAQAISKVHAADPSPGSRRLGVLLFDNAASWDFLAPELRKELATLGWVEGTNLSIEWRFANGDAARLPELAAQMARSGVDAILTRGTPATRALQRATATVPILTGVGDPIGGGFATSYANPGSNITGVSYAVAETQTKQIELLKAMVPRLSRLVILLPANRSAFANEVTRLGENAARKSGIAPRTILVANNADLRAALLPDRAAGVSAALVLGLGTMIEPKELAQIAVRNRIPTIFEYSSYVAAGGLMSYRLNWENQIQRTAAQIDKVFRGATPTQIPFEFPTRSEFVINRATAKALGLSIPQSLLLRADEVIE